MIDEHQEVSDRRLMHQSTPCVDQCQKAMKYEPFVNQRRLKTCSTTHFRCKTTHSKTTVLKNAYTVIAFINALIDTKIQYSNGK